MHSFCSFDVVEVAYFVLAHAGYEGAEAERGENACWTQSCFAEEVGGEVGERGEEEEAAKKNAVS